MHAIDRRAVLQGAAVIATLAGSGSALAGGSAPPASAPSGPFTQPPLPYPVNALEPTIGAKTVEIHYGRHHKSYFDNLNKMTPGTPHAGMSLEQLMKETRGKADQKKIFNNAGQAWNHVIYWEQFAPGGAKQPTGQLAEMIQRDFGGLDKFKAQFVSTAGDVFGTGWAWLIKEGDKLAIVGTEDADNPLAQGKQTLMGIDVWEHAYYLDYQNRRTDHVKAVLDNLINWDYVAKRAG